jgi:hypothetical protein
VVVGDQAVTERRYTLNAGRPENSSRKRSGSTRPRRRARSRSSGPMDRFLGRLLPGRIRRDVFEPALHDLRNDSLRDLRALRSGPPALLRVLVLIRVLVLFLDCWRVAVLSSRPIATARLPDRLAPPH